MQAQWNRRITRRFEGDYLPVELASAALSTKLNRIFVGSTQGTLYAFNPEGRKLYDVGLDAGIESAPALDASRDELFVGTTGGQVVALRASDGRVLWKTAVAGAVRATPVFSSDTVYVATHSDQVLAIDRGDGSVLWRYSRELPDAFSITYRAGILLLKDRLVTGFTDGVIVALALEDGQPLWQRDTSVDVRPDDNGDLRFIDVDSTPTLVGQEIWTASFAGGLYALSPENGAVLFHERRFTGVTSITVADSSRVLLSSGDLGIVLLRTADRKVLWRREADRGSMAIPAVHRGKIVVGETRGSLLALTLDEGWEIGRFESGHGFSAPVSAQGGLAFVLSNGGTFHAFAL